MALSDNIRMAWIRVIDKTKLRLPQRWSMFPHVAPLIQLQHLPARRVRYQRDSQKPVCPCHKKQDD
jgi:hypothetical protein